MKIGVITNYHLEEIGGAEEAIDRLATRWLRSGHEVKVFSSSARRRGYQRVWRPVYRHVRIPTRLSMYCGDIYRIWIESIVGAHSAILCWLVTRIGLDTSRGCFLSDVEFRTLRAHRAVIACTEVAFWTGGCVGSGWHLLFATLPG